MIESYKRGLYIKFLYIKFLYSNVDFVLIRIYYFIWYLYIVYFNL